MKLITAIVHGADAGRALKTLVAHDFRVTEIGSTGGFLRRKNVTLLIAVEDHRVEAAIALLRDCCQTRKETVATNPPFTVTVGGAVIFTQAIERFERL